jgi:DNA-binding GntR family transcriptional regulator
MALQTTTATPEPGTKPEPGTLAPVPSGRARDISAELHDAILEHRLGPGTKLSEEELGEIFGASRTVVRSALQALAHSGLVTIERNRGAFVARPSRREAQEVFEARALIERRVARLAAEAMTTGALKDLRRHIAAEHAALRAGDKGKALSLSGRFHTAIADIAAQAVFADMVRSLVSRSSLIIALYWQSPDATCQSHAHAALLDAFAAHDGDAAEALMDAHITDLRACLDLSDRPTPQMSLRDALGKPAR